MYDISKLAKVSYALLLVSGTTAASVVYADAAGAETTPTITGNPTETGTTLAAAPPIETAPVLQVAPEIAPEPVALPVAAPVTNPLPLEQPVVTLPQPLAASARPSQQAKDLLGPTTLPPLVFARAPEGWSELVAQNPTTPQRFRRSAFYFGNRNPDPNVLAGPTREQVVPAADPYRGGTSISAGGQINITPRQRVNLEVRGGESILGAEASYFVGSSDPRRGLNMNVFGVQSYSPSFRSDDRDVRLPDGTQNPIVDRLGGGVQWLQPLASKLDAAFGVSYQRVAIREDFFSNATVPFDEFGNRLSVSNRGIDDLLTLGAALKYDTRDFAADPMRGTHLRFGFDQAIPVGNASINMTRLNLSAAQFFQISRRQNIVLSAQGGHMFGDIPPYEAFNLGGMNTVRGYGRGELGTGASFVQASLEYRFPLFGFKFIRQDVKVRGVLFADYGSTLGSQDNVIGRPGEVRDKPGSGFGVGGGARVRVGPALARFEVGVSDRGDLGVYFGLGERF
jgi:outer membrane protein insertion porin family